MMRSETGPKGPELEGSQVLSPVRETLLTPTRRNPCNVQIKTHGHTANATFVAGRIQLLFNTRTRTNTP